jgi:hypothetical protein
MAATVSEKTPVVDTGKMLRRMDEKIAVTTDERHRRNLEMVRRHMYHETMLDPDGIMSTVSPEANYRLWNDGIDYGPKGFDGIRDFYIDTFRNDKTIVLEYDLERIVVDDAMVVTEGPMKVVVDGRYAARNFGRDFAPDDIYLQSYRLVVFWPIADDGKLLGEEFYPCGINGDHAWRKLEADEVPDQWYSLVELSSTL